MTSAGLPLVTIWLIPRSLMSRLCVTSSENSLSFTVSPFFTVISGRSECESMRVNFDGSAGLIGDCHSGTTNAKCCNSQDIFCFVHPCPIHFPNPAKREPRQPSEENRYGAMYFKRIFSSSRDSRARVRMCMITVPVIRGERLMGAWWHREQLAAKTFAPASAGAEDAPRDEFCRAASLVWRGGAASSPKGNKRRHAYITRRFIFPPRTTTES